MRLAFVGGEIAVICASPPGVNPGMDSVDLALLHVADRHGFRDRLQFYRLYSPQSAPGSGRAQLVSYSIIPSATGFFESKQAVIYWGDFLHMRQYHETVARRLVRDGLCETADLAELRVRQVFLQWGQAPDVIGKTLSFGGTLIFNTVSDEMHPEYRAALEQFLKSCKAAWFRDVYSAFKACLIRGTFEPPCLGVDCANLIDPDEAYPLGARPAVEDRVGIFLGRTAENIQTTVGFASQLARRLGCRPTWLSWGDADAFPSLPSIMKLEGVRTLDLFSEQLGRPAHDGMLELLRYRAIVTDTYHVCVNAWNLGVPAVCLIGNDYSNSRNVNFGDAFAPRDKRVVFLSMYDALDFLVPHAELENTERSTARLSHLVGLIQSGKEIREIQSRIRAHAASAECSFVQTLSQLL